MFPERRGPQRSARRVPCTQKQHMREREPRARAPPGAPCAGRNWSTGARRSGALEAPPRGLGTQPPGARFAGRGSEGSRRRSNFECRSVGVERRWCQPIARRALYVCMGAECNRGAFEGDADPSRQGRARAGTVPDRGRTRTGRARQPGRGWAARCVSWWSIAWQTKVADVAKAAAASVVLPGPPRPSVLGKARARAARRRPRSLAR
eukprot:gene1622-biopygen6074